MQTNHQPSILGNNSRPTITSKDHATAAHAYARAIASGEKIACKWVRLAAERHLRDLASIRRPDYPYTFDTAKANKAISFIELLPHTKGKWASKRELIKLEPWQKFIIGSIFGWVRKDNGLRRFREAYICVPRKNAKSTLAAGIGLYMLVADGEFGPEVFCGATSEKQALEVFRPARLMVKRTKKLQEKFGIEVNSKSLNTPDDGGRFEALIGDPGDGASPSLAIVDEYHEHQRDNLYDTMLTGMGARLQPLMLVITTAGVNIAGPCHMMQSEVEKILEGTISQESRFGLVYTIDAEDDWTSTAALEKANPNFGVSVFADFLRIAQEAAVLSARKQNIFKTKHLNVWCGAAAAWLNMLSWNALADPTLTREKFAGQPCNIGADLSSAIDITSCVQVFKAEIDGVMHYYVFGRHYLPRERAEDPEKQHYQKWLHEGRLVGIDGPTIDYSVIRRDLLADTEAFAVESIAFDPWAAVETQQELQRELGEDVVISIPQLVKYLSYPMKELEALVIAGRIHHDGDPVLAWMLSNVVAHTDANDNIFPRKEQPENKIDGAVALIMALSRAITASGTKFQQYNGF